jgi:hypothetical protein
MVGMTTPPAETRRVLRITFDGETVHGFLDDDADRTRRFVGWLELLAAIHDLRADTEGPSQT